MEIIACLITAIATIICAFIAAVNQKEHKSAEAERARVEKRAAERKNESLLLLQLIHADCALTVGTAMALKNGHCNGELEQGLNEVDTAMAAYDSFHNNIALTHLTK